MAIGRVANQAFELSAMGIDRMSEFLEAQLTHMRVARRNRLRIRLAMEEAMYRAYEHFGEGVEEKAELSVGTNLAGSFVRIELREAAFNPLGEAGARADEWASSLISSVDLRPQYAYINGVNVLRVSFERIRINPAIGLIAGILVGVGLGVAGDAIMPDDLQAGICNNVIDPIFGLWTRMLNAIAGPVIFFMVMTTMLNTQKVEERGGSKITLVARYFAICFLAGLSAAWLAVPMFQPNFASEFVGLVALSEMLAGAAQVIPAHILEPFSTSNTPQLMLVAFVLGNAIIALGDRAKELATVVRQINMANSLVTSWVSVLVPVITALLLMLEIWNNQVGVLIDLWKPLALSLVMSLLFMAGNLVVVCRRLGVRAKTMIRKIVPPFAVAVRTGSLDASYGEAEYSCTKGLGIEPTFTEVTLPQGLVIYMPVSVIGTLVFTVFDAESFGVHITIWWGILAALLDVLLFVATPPVPGANLLAFITLFQVLGIPDEALFDAMVFDIAFGLFANAANQAVLQLEIALQANRLGLINKEVLRR